MNDTFPLSLPGPESDATPVTMALVRRVQELSRHSPRRRIIQILHKGDADPLQRMLNAMQPGTIFRAHRHLDPPKAEFILMITGALRVVLFDAHGNITAHHELRAGGELFGFDFAPGVFHTLIVLEPDSVMLECKTGPYSPASDKDFPDWAPPEDSPEAQALLERIIRRTGGL